MVRVANSVLITIEDEHTAGWRHFLWNYQEIFQALGMVEVQGPEDVDGFVVRVFRKPARLSNE